MRKKVDLLFPAVTIEAVAAEGKALAHVDGMVVFVEYAVPGDVVEIREGQLYVNDAPVPDPPRMFPQICGHNSDQSFRPGLFFLRHRPPQRGHIVNGSVVHFTSSFCFAEGFFPVFSGASGFVGFLEAGAFTGSHTPESSLTTSTVTPVFLLR